MTAKKMFLKIKRIKKEKKTSITIQWDERSPSGWETKTLDCEEPSRPEFHEAFNALAPQVPALIGVHEDWDTNLKVNGITYSYDEYGHRAIAIQSIKDLEGFDSPLVVNVPACYAPDSSPLGALVDALEAEAELYLARNRAQLELALVEKSP